MTTTINLEPQTIRTARAHRVYLKASWPAAWVRVPWLFATEIAWRLAPGLGSAALEWDYGLGQRQGELTPAIVERLADKRRQFVKIEIDTHAVTAAEISGDTPLTPLKWYGTIELDGRIAEGFVQTGTDAGQPVLAPRGSQPFAALGIEQLLHRHFVRGSSWLDSAGAVQRSDRTFTFNRPTAAGQPQGNRSTGRGPASHLFSSQETGEDKKWSTRTIVEYLVANEVPRGPAGAEHLKFIVHESYAAFLPEWDVPVIDPEGMTCGQLLNLLMPRSRMFSWFLQVEAGTDPATEVAKLVPISLFGDIVTTDLGSFSPNQRQIELQTTVTGDLSPDTMVALHENDIQKVDQVRVRGARRTSTCTVSDDDLTIGKGWPSDLENEYEAGYTGDLGTDPSKQAQQIAHAEIRDADRLATVFRRFAIPAAWDQTVGNGLGELTGEARKAVFLKDPSLTEKYLVCPRELELAPTLPINAGFDWSDIGGPEDGHRTDPDKLDDSAHNRLPALVLFKLPYKEDPDDVDEADRYVQVDTIGQRGRIAIIKQQAPMHWSGRVEVPHQDRAVVIDAQGAPQHIMAYADFDPLPVDEEVGWWDWRSALFTVCIYDDRFAEGVVPKDAAADAALTNVRRELVIDAGDAYRLDYIVPLTVIGIDRTTRGLLRCELGGWINDDRKLLTARALMIFKYYGVTRRSLSLTTSLLTSQLSIGDYIISIGRETDPREVGTVINEITLTIPGGNATAGPPQIHYTTAFAEIEPGTILNRPHVRYHRTPEHVPTKRL